MKRAKYLSAAAFLIASVLTASCRDEHDNPELPPAENPEIPEVNPVDGIWIEESASDLQNGQERRLTFSSDKTFTVEVCDNNGAVINVERSGSYRVSRTTVSFDNDDIRDYEISDQRLKIAAASDGSEPQRFYRHYNYTEGIRAASKLIVSSDAMITEAEINAFKGYMISNSELQVPAKPMYDNTWVFRMLGKSMSACTRMFEITCDLTFLNRTIEYADAALFYRNGQPGGDSRIVDWTGHADDVWPSTGEDVEKISAAVEQGAVLARIAYGALLIYRTPSIWNLRVAADDPHNYGATYRKRADTYLRMCDEMYENWIRQFQHPGDNVFYRRTAQNFIEPIAWNQALMACDGLNFMSLCHETLGNTARSALYDSVVEANLDFFINDSWTVTSASGTTCLQWRYSKTADKIRHAEDLNHASLVANVMYNLYIGGHHPQMNTVIEQIANTMFDIVFCTRDDQGRFPGRISGVYDGKYCDSYIRDDHMQLADIRKDHYADMLNINAKRIPGNLPMAGRALWCKSRRIDPPSGITAHFDNGSRSIILSWQPTDATVKILHSTDLWSWEEVATVQSATSYKDHRGTEGSTNYYRLVAVKGSEAGYSPLITVR